MAPAILRLGRAYRMLAVVLIPSSGLFSHTLPHNSPQKNSIDQYKTAPRQQRPSRPHGAALRRLFDECGLSKADRFKVSVAKQVGRSDQVVGPFCEIKGRISLGSDRLLVGITGPLPISLWQSR